MIHRRLPIGNGAGQNRADIGVLQRRSTVKASDTRASLRRTTGGSPFRMVAAATALDFEKFAADPYVCSGANDDDVIMAAHNIIRDTAYEGARLLFSGGDFFIDNPIGLGGDYWIPWEGSGEFATFIYWDGSTATGPMVTAGVISNMTLVTGGGGSGLTALAVNRLARDVQVGGDGLGIIAAAAGCVLDNVRPNSLTGGFIEVQADDVEIVNTYLHSGWSAARPAIHAISSNHGLSVRSCKGVGNGTLIAVDDDCDRTTIADSDFRQLASSGEPLIDIASDNVDVTGVRMDTSAGGSAKAVRLQVGASHCAVAFDTFRGFATEIDDLGSSNVTTPNVSA